MVDVGILTEFAVYLVTLTILGVNLSKADSERPFMSFFATSVMACASLSHYFRQTWDLSHESLIVPWYDEYTQSLTLFTLAYMFADLPILLYLGKLETYERAMFVLHHVVSAIQLACSIYYNRYQRLILFFITVEVTNIFLNFRKLIPQTGTFKLIIDLIFVASFLSYRMSYVIPILLRTLFTLAMNQEWFDLFVINSGALFVGILHFWWTYLILVGIYEVIVPPKNKEKSE